MEKAPTIGDLIYVFSPRPLSESVTSQGCCSTFRKWSGIYCENLGPIKNRFYSKGLRIGCALLLLLTALALLAMPVTRMAENVKTCKAFMRDGDFIL